MIKCSMQYPKVIWPVLQGHFKHSNVTQIGEHIWSGKASKGILKL